MTEILVVTWDGGGNVPPALGIATELVRRGHGVRVLGHETQRQAVAALGLPFRAYESTAAFSALDDNSPLRMISLFTDRSLGADVVAEARRAPTDVTVVDCLLTGAQRACSQAGLTYVSLEHLYDGYLRGGWLRGPMGMVARLKGLRPVASWDGAARTVVATLSDLDPGAARPAPLRRVWTGPVLDVPAPHDLSSHEPAVLISLSTFRYAGMLECLQRLLDATATLGVRVVVTTGPVIDPAPLRVAAHHEVHQFVPHDELLPQMSLVVGHGGHATTMRALAHDVPLVVMPLHPMLDQPMVGRTVENAGAGQVVRKKASRDELTEVITRLVADGPHRAAAATLGARIREARGAEAAASLVLDAVTNGVAAH